MLLEPLREHAIRLLRDLDEARVDKPHSVEEQIEREVARRLKAQGKAKSAPTKAKEEVKPANLDAADRSAEDAEQESAADNETASDQPQ